MLKLAVLIMAVTNNIKFDLFLVEHNAMNIIVLYIKTKFKWKGRK